MTRRVLTTELTGGGRMVSFESDSEKGQLIFLVSARGKQLTQGSTGLLASQHVLPYLAGKSAHACPRLISV